MVATIATLIVSLDLFGFEDDALTRSLAPLSTPSIR
jgi:hypothetical protein